MLKYRWKEKAYATGEGAEDFEAVTVRLYTAILEYEARLVCHLSRHAAQRYVKAVVKTDWKEMVKNIRVLEGRCNDLTSAIDVCREKRAQNDNLRMTGDLVNLQKEYQAERRSAKDY
jgi:hypothetical protein